MAPELEAFDHVHVFVSNRAKAEVWYRQVLGLVRIRELEFWAADGGPLTLENPSGTIHIALFERPPQPCRSTIALRVGAAAYAAWRRRLDERLPGQATEEDHVAARSIYFRDPDGNPYEITTYEPEVPPDAEGPPT